MDEILKIANKYWLETEHPKFWLSPHNYFFYIFIITALLFGYCFYFYYPKFGDLHDKELFQNKYFIGVLLLELLSVFSWLKASLKKYKIIISNHLQNSKNDKTIKDVKVKLLNELTGTTEHGYMQMAERLIYINENIKNFKKPFRITIESFFSKIYSNEAKSRVIAWIAIFLSIATALSINSGATIENVFSFYKSASTSTIVFLYTTIVILSSAAMIITRGIIIFLSQLLFYFSILIDNEKSKDTYTVKHLIRDLLQYSKPISKSFKTENQA